VSRESPPPGGEGGTLESLLQLERRIEAEIAAVRAEAEQRVESARDEARRLESDAGGSIEAALSDLRDSIERQTAAEIEQQARAARAEAERYRDVDEQTLARLALGVVARILATQPPA
jgi:vacuolar-type H+-ATPase subunit H